MAKQIIWSARARNDLFEILDFWEKKNKSSVYSEKLFSLFEHHLNTISLHPEIGKNTTARGVKSKVVSHYLLLYRVLYEEIELITIWDNRRNPDRLNEMLDT